VELVVQANQMRVLDPSLSPKDRNDVQARMVGAEVLDATRFVQIRFRSTAVQPLEPDHWLCSWRSSTCTVKTHQIAVKVARQGRHWQGLDNSSARRSSESRPLASGRDGQGEGRDHDRFRHRRPRSIRFCISGQRPAQLRNSSQTARQSLRNSRILPRRKMRGRTFIEQSDHSGEFAPTSRDSLMDGVAECFTLRRFRQRSELCTKSS
jgi:hypothetical protein